jgi:hypothetical protein
MSAVTVWVLYLLSVGWVIWFFQVPQPQPTRRPVAYRDNEEG